MGDELPFDTTLFCSPSNHFLCAATCVPVHERVGRHGEIRKHTDAAPRGGAPLTSLRCGSFGERLRKSVA
jgi:hypothetical protein